MDKWNNAGEALMPKPVSVQSVVAATGWSVALGQGPALFSLKAGALSLKPPRAQVCTRLPFLFLSRCPAEELPFPGQDNASISGDPLL